MTGDSPGRDDLGRTARDALGVGVGDADFEAENDDEGPGPDRDRDIVSPTFLISSGWYNEFRTEFLAYRTLANH